MTPAETAAVTSDKRTPWYRRWLELMGQYPVNPLPEEGPV